MATIGRAAAAPFHLADLRGGGEAVHLRHLAVHEHRVVAGARHRLHRFAPVVGDVHSVAQLLEDPHRHLLVHLVVLGHEHAGGEGRAGLAQAVARDEGGAGGSAHQDLGQAVVQVGLVHRLGEVAGDAGAGRLRAVALLAEGREQDELHRGQGRVGLDGAGEGETIHVRHLEVEHGQVEGGAAGGRRAQGGKGAGPVLHRGDAQPPVGELLAKDLAIGGVVVHHEDAPAGQPGGRYRCRRRLAGLALEAGGEPEGAALARMAVHVDGPPHEADQPLRDREAQSGAAVPTGGGAVGLDEGLEQARPQLRGDADAGVADLEADPGVAGAALQRGSPGARPRPSP